MEKQRFRTTHPSPVGLLHLIATDTALAGLLWDQSLVRHADLVAGAMEESNDVLEQAKAELDAYFEQKRTVFTVPVVFFGTDFQKLVWAELQKIPFGSTTTYGQLAHRLGNPNASRAVGAANGRNPVSIIVPCHRVIGTEGKLTGFGGGLEAKQKLLILEQQLLF
jgi:methylated-DNA-[protein]-cysteine S-methyltransferase